MQHTALLTKTDSSAWTLLSVCVCISRTTILQKTFAMCWLATILRHSYEQTLSLFGRTPIYKDSIIEQGYSYNRSVSNLRSMIKEIGVSEKEFVKIFRSILQESYYDDIQATLAEYFKGKGIIDAEECIKKLERSDDAFQELLSVKN